MLTAAEITELTTESAPFAILNEWLRLWFDGHPHAVGNQAPVLFPKANIAFGQSPAVQPLYDFQAGVDAEIRCVIFPRSELADDLDTILFSGKLATANVLLHFWIAAQHPGTGQSEHAAQTIAQLLKAICTNPDAKYPLAQKGILSLQPKPVEWLRSTDYAKRLLAVVGQLQYPILFGDSTVTAPSDDGEQSLQFAQEQPLLPDHYLMGAYQWNARRMQLTGAAFVAWPPTGADVVLGLEVGGVLTGDELVIPAGLPNVDTTGSLALNVTIPITLPVRWKVLSAPIPEASAWHVTVNVTAVPV